ncbi:hypothetical protein AB0N65_05505 [Paenarthrobacter sp. NPDC089322]|uniref:hypothetical protein n=1 Tax=Paenarthrobacter sp. NPDC089322 TaxID=3155065 RepID=UPI00343828D5
MGNFRATQTVPHPGWQLADCPHEKLGSQGRGFPGHAMTARRLVIIGLCLALVIAAAAVIFDQLARQGSTSAQSPASSSPTSDASTGTATGDAEATASGSPTPGATAGTTPEGSDGATSTAKPLEVLPPVTSTPTGLPAPSSPAPLITGGLPAAGSARGEVVDGWPGDILTLPQGTTVGSTSISVSGDILQLTADGIVNKSQADVLADFRQSLTGHGFWSEDASAPEGSVAQRFVRGADTVTVSVSLTGTGSSRFQLLGSLRTAAD